MVQRVFGSVNTRTFTALNLGVWVWIALLQRR